MARIERESGRRRREEKWQTCWCCRGQQRACRMAQASAEKLEQSGSAEKSGLKATKKAAVKYTEAALAKRKSNRAVCSKYQIVSGKRVKVSGS